MTGSARRGARIRRRPTGYTETLAEHAATIDAVLDAATVSVVREQDELGIDVPVTVKGPARTTSTIIAAAPSISTG
ncbi:MAG: hypothetical protein R3C97_14625 [Geminicoccaceae bacterium]